MRKRLQIGLAVMLAALAGVIAWQVLQAPRERQPVYGGKPLTLWFEALIERLQTMKCVVVLRIMPNSEGGFQRPAAVWTFFVGQPCGLREGSRWSPEGIEGGDHRITAAYSRILKGCQS
jgi:hypothetical protein